MKRMLSAVLLALAGCGAAAHAQSSAEEARQELREGLERHTVLLLREQQRKKREAGRAGPPEAPAPGLLPRGFF